MKKSTFYALCLLFYANFLLAQAPVVDSFTPTTICLGDTVTITGSNLTDATEVSFGGIAVTSFTVVDDTTITAVVDTGDSGSVAVVNADGDASLAGFVLNTPSVGGTITAVYYKCTGEGQLELVGAVGEIQWQVSTNNVSFNDIDDEVATTLTFSGLTNTTYYRAVVTNGFCSSTYSDTYTALIKRTNLTGTEWSNGEPDADALVTISADYEPTGDLAACVLTVNNNAVVFIADGSNLLLEDKLTVTPGAKVILSSNANLMQATDVQNTGNIVVRRNSAAIKRLDYTLWSSPVVGQQLATFSPNTLTTRFYTYNPSSDLYEEADTSLDFATGNGYLIRTPNNHPSSPTAWAGHFNGVPNNGDQNITVTDGSYNAIGNPYPSTIDADAFITDNSITEALYFWRKTNNAPGTTYATYTLAGGVGTANDNGELPSGVIQVGQGFIAKATSGTVSFTNSMRVVDNNNQFFKAGQQKSRFWLNLANANGTLSQTMVAYMPNATNGYDGAIDGKYFNDSPTALTSVLNNQEYAIQGRGLPFSANDTVALGFKSDTAGTFIISLDHTDGLFANNQNIYLKDNLNNTIYDLTQGSYTFSSNTGVYNSRFEIVYQNLLGVSQPNLTTDSLIVYTENHQLVVSSANVLLDNVKVFDIQGRLLKEVKTINANEVKIALDNTNEIILVKATAIDGITATKKVIK